LPCLLLFRFVLILTRLYCASWRGDRAIQIRRGGSWRWLADGLLNDKATPGTPTIGKMSKFKS
jgi:hypothetical protein